MSHKFDVETRDHWTAPRGEESLVKVLTMPNIVKPLHSVAPRTVLGASWWNIERKKCYMHADYKCEVCGKELSPGQVQAHEMYDFDYKTGEQKYVRAVCLCKTHHQYPGVHTGRAKTCYSNHDIFMTRKVLLEGFESIFTIVASYNAEHRSTPPLRLNAAILAFMDTDLAEPIIKLIDKYDIKFWSEPPQKECCAWGDWHLVVGDKSYPTPYASVKDWEDAMSKKNADRATLTDPFAGIIPDELKTMLEEE